MEAGISVYAVDDAAEADELVEERAAHARRETHEDYVLVPRELVVRAGLVVEEVEDPDGATERLRLQHCELRLRPGVSNADVPRDELEAALRRLAGELLRRDDLLERVRRVDRKKIQARIATLLPPETG